MKYLYLDDQEEQKTVDIVDLLSDEIEDLQVEHVKPKSFGAELERLKGETYDGLLLDLRLDEKSEAEYRAFSLAQELRTRATENEIRDVPIVVCSTYPKLKFSYSNDATSHDLFDKKYLKDEELVDKSETVALELYSLAVGYIKIDQIKQNLKGVGVQLRKFFCLPDTDIDQLDTRLIKFFGERQDPLPVHEYARFIMREMLEKAGPLVDEKLLAARLGVDTDCEDFTKLINRDLEKFRFTGPFSEGWKRWWWHLVEQWWNNLPNSPGSLAFLNAADRVGVLNEELRLNLKVAKSIDKEYSTRFWSVCKFYQQPLDPFDGLLTEMSREPFAWQDSEYISIKAALDPNSKASNIFPHPIERERLKEING
ncbi:hypothetical protein CLV24_11717 [Pontibacter ummariensis]|uniref:Uncharacterized protein n=1 Tax=Pontibacter ummariensis TaxID=1610492 RepID=A0A239IFI2_9BACT|nr:hypothetical protein [Pontibacter ummariensis]PRY09813.1 hypothetical protein CLV24_11717 [Pontibacter ummariensis]SNS92018.1 hypothetical protein SAMN06296052_11717 [Pontibacter ummariensis]